VKNFTPNAIPPGISSVSSFAETEVGLPKANVSKTAANTAKSLFAVLFIG